MDAATKQHLKRYWNLGDVKAHPLAKNYTLTIACRIFLDVEDQDIIAKLEKPIQQISNGFVALPINLPGTIYSHAVRASNQLRKDVGQIIKQRRMSINSENREPPKQDLVSRMLMETYTDGQLMDDSDIANQIFGLLIGAFDTTNSTLVSIREMPQVYDGILRGGPRMCLGKEYARLKILIFLHNFVTKFRWEKVFPEEKIVYDPLLKPIRDFIFAFILLIHDRLAGPNM
ncbi:Beta-amyrin 28-oxidase [Morella rubra]|uniref:Beta-amyrin 28-oxidase n=1 Tax=Morella rubra TaxID=262757 RepID=A0A6A1V487_9ROSI|nr:Beta-amyrin 28-oxidase [Morella rubra]